MIKSQFYIVLNNYKDHFPVGPIGQVPAVDADISDKVKGESERGYFFFVFSWMLFFLENL
jgi:hypothetical protein